MSFFLFCAAGVLAGIVAEYWVHRLQHARILHTDEHAFHHLANESYGVWHEFAAYMRIGIVPMIVAVGFVGCVAGALAVFGLCVGLVGFFAFVAFTHEVYHTDENLVFWVDRPIHHFHHAKNQWKHNFAFTNTLMDRLFGTFLDDPTWSRKPVRLRELLKVRWL